MSEISIVLTHIILSTGTFGEREKGLVLAESGQVSAPKDWC